MQSALWVSKTGLDAQDKNIANIANNLANVNTAGFKRGRAVFEDLIYQNLRQAGAQSSQNTDVPTGINLGTGVRLVATQKNFDQGSPLPSGDDLHVMISGRGFLQVLMPDGSLSYTRDGQLTKNSQGQLVTSNGYLIQPTVTVPAEANSLTIARDGTVSVSVKGQVSQIANLQLADFINPGGLQPVGQNLFTETVASGTPQINAPGSAGLGSIDQHFVEGSNVNVVEELVNMIQAQRAYEITAKGIQTVDDMLKYITQTL
jgi:flagellar basal-body rod protein FlgG